MNCHVSKATGKQDQLWVADGPVPVQNKSTALGELEMLLQQQHNHLQGGYGSCSRGKGLEKSQPASCRNPKTDDTRASEQRRHKETFEL